MPITVEEIAKLAGVSRATVSRVVNHHPNIRPEVRERVERIIAEYNYHPNRAAQSLATHRTNAIGLIVPNSFPLLFNDTFFPRLIQGIAEVCNANDYTVTVTLTTEPERQMVQFRHVLSSGAIDGVVVANAGIDDPLLPLLRDSGLPFVLVGRNPVQPDLCYVDVDNVSGARVMTRYLIGLNHRAIGIVTGPLGRSAGRDRLEGYRLALEAAGIPFDDALVAEGDFTEQGGYQAARQLIAAQPTAIFACSDMMALGVLRALAGEGLRVPDDVSVAGFDDFLAATAANPALTTIAQPVVELGAAAAALLVDLINAKGAPQTHDRTLPVQLVIRQSTRRLDGDAASR